LTTVSHAVTAGLGQHGTLEATYFRMDYENQIIPASVAGGIGATLTSAGETRHEGLELGGRWNLPYLLGSRHGLSLRTSYTWIPTAEFVGTRFSSIAGFQQGSVTGNRLPYAARRLVNSSIVYSHASGTTVFLEGNFTTQQFGDDLNTIQATPNGQRGIVPGNAVWNATLNVPLESHRSTLFFAVKNLFDRTYIVDRTRGILPAMPRQFQGGVRFRL
jgi:Fe(3+) dicitrate transport protein